jgi:hypothetical protein
VGSVFEYTAHTKPTDMKKLILKKPEDVEAKPYEVKRTAVEFSMMHGETLFYYLVDEDGTEHKLSEYEVAKHSVLKEISVRIPDAIDMEHTIRAVEDALYNAEEVTDTEYEFIISLLKKVSYA